MKKFLAVLLAFAMVFTLAACGGEKQESGDSSLPTYKIKLPHGYGETHIAHKACLMFQEEMDKRTDGRVQVEIYPNSTLATEEQIYEGVRAGTYEMGIFGIGYGDLLPICYSMQLPFLFKDAAHARKVMADPELGPYLTGDTESIGFINGGCFPAGFRIMSSNKKLESINDLKGFRLRMANIASMVHIGELLGANVQAMSMTEIFSALEQGVIDGQENPATTIRANGWYEVQDYLTMTNHVFTPLFYFINADWYNNMDEETRGIMDEVLKEVIDFAWDSYEEDTAADLKYMEDAGCELVYPSEQFRQEMIDATYPIYEEMYQQFPELKGVIDKISAM